MGKLISSSLTLLQNLPLNNFLTEGFKLALQVGKFQMFFFYYRGFKLTGPFVIMIYRMLAADLLKFGVMYSIFIMGFAQCKYYIILTSISWPY